MEKKKDLYVITKILKFVTDGKAKSYECKFAVNDLLQNRQTVSDEEFGSAIRAVIHHVTIRGKFSSIHPDLKRLGFTRVEVGEEGLLFIRESSGGVFIIAFT